MTKSMGFESETDAASVDVKVARRLKFARIESGLTGGGLGKKLGITGQQVSKMERNVNRIHIGQLWMASKILNKPIDWFFETSGEEGRGRSSVRRQQEFLEIVADLDDMCLQMIARMARSLVSRA